jgi:hypothetical protein
MEIGKSDLEDMNDLLKKGKTFAEVWELFPKYDYWDIYWQVNAYSFLGRKRTITNRLNSLVTTTSKSERKEIVKEAKELLDELYDQLKSNSAKLIDIDQVLRGK